MNGACFLCNGLVSEDVKNPIKLFDNNQILQSGKTLSQVVSAVVDRDLFDEGSYSNTLCSACYARCIEYDKVHTQLQNIRNGLLQKFKSTLAAKGMQYENFGTADTLPRKTVSPLHVRPIKNLTSPKKLFTLPASKLQPLPANYVINMNSLRAMSKSTPLVPNATAVQNVPKTTVKIVSPEALKETLPARSKSVVDDIDPVNNANGEVNQTRKPSMPSLDVDPLVSDASQVLSFLSKDLLTSAVLTRIEGKDDAAIELPADEGLENNDEQPMEIDEDCRNIRGASEAIDRKENDSEVSTQSSYYEANLLRDLDAADVKSEYLLGNLEILEEGDDDDVLQEHTIVMEGSPSDPIIRVVSGKRIVYKDNKLSLVSDDEHDNDDDGESPDEDDSQIELQVSGDEETANAIIAAAKEQGGAFIKVESGEMYRVKSVQSKTKGEAEVEYLPPMVERKGDLYTCLLCDQNEDDAKKFSNDAEKMMSHMKTEHNTRVYICQICGLVLRKRDEYNLHITKHSNGTVTSDTDKQKVHDCSLCPKKYTSKTLLREHMNTHTGFRPYKCGTCHKSYASKYTFQSHLTTHTDRPRPFKCAQCGKTFLSQQNLTQHEKIHSGVKDFKCIVCGKAFASLHNLEVHCIVHTGERPFACRVCGKAFARRAEVRNHVRTHTGERPFKCDMCNSTFSQRSNLQSHRRATHLNDKRYHCEHCPKQFKRRRLLDYHIKASHTGERPLQCEVCTATFVYPEHYKKHARIHSGEKPFECEVCGKTFNSRDNRNTHRFVHSDKKPYECVVCGAGYMRKQLLYAHMQSSGHVAESIVVNQPRVTKVVEEAPSDIAFITVDAKTDTIPNKGSPDFVITTTEGDKKFLFQDSKLEEATAELVISSIPTGDKQFILQGHTEVSDVKNETAILEATVQDDLPVQTLQLTEDNAGSVLQLVQIHLADGNSGWVAINS